MFSVKPNDDIATMSEEYTRDNVLSTLRETPKKQVKKLNKSALKAMADAVELDCDDSSTKRDLCEELYQWLADQEEDDVDDEDPEAPPGAGGEDVDIDPRQAGYAASMLTRIAKDKKVYMRDTDDKLKKAAKNDPFIEPEVAIRRAIRDYLDDGDFAFAYRKIGLEESNGILKEYDADLSATDDSVRDIIASLKNIAADFEDGSLDRIIHAGMGAKIDTYLTNDGAKIEVDSKDELFDILVRFYCIMSVRALPVFSSKRTYVSARTIVEVVGTGTIVTDKPDKRPRLEAHWDQVDPIWKLKSAAMCNLWCDKKLDKRGPERSERSQGNTCGWPTIAILLIAWYDKHADEIVRPDDKAIDDFIEENKEFANSKKRHLPTDPRRQSAKAAKAGQEAADQAEQADPGAQASGSA